jgi:hypothetical protein
MLEPSEKSSPVVSIDNQGHDNFPLGFIIVLIRPQEAVANIQLSGARELPPLTA